MSQENAENKRLISKDYVLICVVATFLRMAMTIVLTIIPLFAISIGYSKAQAGLLITVYTISALVLRPIGGRLIDKLGRRKMLYIGTILYIAAIFPIAFTQELTILFFAQVLSGIGFSIYSVALPTMITDIVPESKLTAGLGYFGLTSTLVQAIAPTIALALMNKFGYSEGFLLVSVALLPVLLINLFITYEKKRKIEEIVKDSSVASTPPVKIPFWSQLIEKNALGPAIYTFAFAIIMSLMTAFLVPYATQAGIANIGIYFTFNAIGTALSRAFVGPLNKKFNSATLISFSIVGIILGTGGIFLFTDFVPLMIAAFLNGLSFGMIMVLNNVTAVKNTPPERRAAANATFYLAMDAGMGLGAAGWGMMADLTGLRNTFGEASFLAMLIFVIFVVTNRIKSHRKNKENNLAL